MKINRVLTFLHHFRLENRRWAEKCCFWSYAIFTGFEIGRVEVTNGGRIGLGEARLFGFFGGVIFFGVFGLFYIMDDIMGEEIGLGLSNSPEFFDSLCNHV